MKIALKIKPYYDEPVVTFQDFESIDDVMFERQNGRTGPVCHLQFCKKVLGLGRIFKPGGQDLAKGGGSPRQVQPKEALE